VKAVSAGISVARGIEIDLKAMVAEADRAQESRQITTQGPHGGLMVRTVVHGHDEKDGGARERRGDRLGNRGRHASLHTDLFGGSHFAAVGREEQIRCRHPSGIRESPRCRARTPIGDQL